MILKALFSAVFGFGGLYLAYTLFSAVLDKLGERSYDKTWMHILVIISAFVGTIFLGVIADSFWVLNLWISMLLLSVLVSFIQSGKETTLLMLLFTFSVTMTLLIAFYYRHQTRDWIGQNFVETYSVHYEETEVASYSADGDFEGMEPTVVAHVETGSEGLNFFFEVMFPILFAYLLGAILYLIWRFNLNLAFKKED